MHKHRGRPNDLANKAAERQRKELAAAIHVQRISRDEVVPRLELSQPRTRDQKTRKVREPTRTIGTISSKPQPTVSSEKVSIPYEPKWESSKMPNSKSFMQELRKKIGSKEKGDGKNVIERHLEEVSYELKVGNAQLEQIKKLLDSSGGDAKAQSAYGKKDVDIKPRKKLPEKNRFVLTLNDVQQRMQKMQYKFFNGNNMRYRSVRSFYNTKIPEEDESVEEDKVDKAVGGNVDEPPKKEVCDEREIMASAKRALARRKALVTDEPQPEGPNKNVYQSAWQKSILKSNYLKKEFEQNQVISAVGGDRVKMDDGFLERLEQNFSSRPFAKAKAVKSYWPVFNSLKDTLYETE